MKVIVGLSGGVDSFVSAYILKKNGFDVYGAFFQLFNKEEEELSRCCDINSVGVIERILEIPVKAIDIHKEFEELIIKNFLESYKAGFTPNPCTICNEKIKFGLGFSKAKMIIGESLFATGHYAKVEVDELGDYHLIKGKDRNKDQSYMLWRLSKDALRQTIFPLGDMLKSEVYKIAKALNFPPKKESEDLCFIRGKLFDFLRNHLNINKGKIFDSSGRILGEHNGFYFYTIGQRSGLNVSYKEPLYVIALDAISNSVILGTKDECMFNRCEISEVNILERWDGGDINLKGKVRYRNPEEECILKKEDGKIVVEFCRAQFAVTPGQSLVLYKGDTVFLGGVINKAYK